MCTVTVVPLDGVYFDIYLRTLLILLKTLEVTPAEFFSDPFFNSEELNIDFK